MSDPLPQRRSILVALLLIFLGLVFLLDRFYPDFRVGYVIRLYWPGLIILWGGAKLIDHFAAREQRRASFLSGSEAILLVILAVVLAGLAMRDWVEDRYPDVRVDLNVPPFHQPYSRTQQLAAQVIPAGAHVVVDTLRGNITIRAGNELQVSGNKTSWAGSESSADEMMSRVDIVVQRTPNGYHIHPTTQTSFRGIVGVDLDVQIPKDVSLSVNTPHGDIDILGIAGRIDAGTDSGSVEIHQAGSDVNATLKGGDTRISQVAGNLHVWGRGDKVEISDVAGNANVDGPFVEATQARNIGKTTHCTSPWYDVMVERLTGRLELDEGDIQVANAAGAARILSHNKDIELDNIAGTLWVSNAHGDIKVHYSDPPRDQVNIMNDSGDVDLILPARSNFQISAFSRLGDIDNEFDEASKQLINEQGNGRLNGQFGSGGPTISITTTYGTIQLRKSS